MKSTSCIFVLLQAVLLLAVMCIAPAVSAQSTNQSYPTPVNSNEISAEIKPRDIGDARLTTHFYSVEAGQGDLFLNVATRNFTGDIDLFMLSGLRPLTKIVVYADFGENETGRVIYLRKPEKMLLRVQGRTPGDDPATYRIKFAGSFIASKETDSGDPGMPKVADRGEEGIRVNSVGTILEQPVKRTSKEDVKEEAIREEVTTAEAREPERPDTPTADTPAGKTEKLEEERAKIGVVVTEGTGTDPREKSTGTRSRRNSRNEIRKTRNNITTNRRSPSTRAAPVRAEPAPDPMASIRLVVLFKDGSKIERPMSEVQRFNVDRGVLTVVAKDGTVGRYSILDVLKVTIE